MIRATSNTAVLAPTLTGMGGFMAATVPGCTCTRGNSSAACASTTSCDPTASKEEELAPRRRLSGEAVAVLAPETLPCVDMRRALAGDDMDPRRWSVVPVVLAPGDDDDDDDESPNLRRSAASRSLIRRRALEVVVEESLSPTPPVVLLAAGRGKPLPLSMLKWWQDNAVAKVESGEKEECGKRERPPISPR